MSVPCRVAAAVLLVTVPPSGPGLNCQAFAEEADSTAEARPAASEAELKYWLENMVRFHSFSMEEAAAATGLSPERQLNLRSNSASKINVDPDTINQLVD